MAERVRRADPARMSAALIVARGAGYGSVAGAGTGGLLFAVAGVIDHEGAGTLGVMAFAAVFGALFGCIVGLFGGMVFAAAAPFLIRHRVVTIAAGLTLPAVVRAVIFVLCGAGTVWAPANWVRDTLLMWAFTAPAGGLTAHRVLYGRRPSSAKTAE